MAQDRPDIPAALKREVLVEAGHRCAIPTCRQVPVELAHITPWVKVKEHTFDNLIALCPTCHTRYDRGEMDRLSMRQYKDNLGLLNSRYTEVERQLLKVFAKEWKTFKLDFFGREDVVDASTGKLVTGPAILASLVIYPEMWWMVANLLDDGVIQFKRDKYFDPRKPGGRREYIELTSKGHVLMQRWISGEAI